MIDTHYGKGLAGLFGGAALALSGLLALFVCMLNVSAGHFGPGVVAGLLTVLLGSAGADFIFRAMQGSAAVRVFRTTVSVVLSIGVVSAALLAAGG